MLANSNSVARQALVLLRENRKHPFLTGKTPMVSAAGAMEHLSLSTEMTGEDNFPLRRLAQPRPGGLR